MKNKQRKLLPLTNGEDASENNSVQAKYFFLSLIFVNPLKTQLIPQVVTSPTCQCSQNKIK